MKYVKSYFNIVILLFIISTQALGDTTLKDQMNSDYSSFMNTTKIGETINWGGGKLTRTESGANFIDPSGAIIIMPEKNPDFNALALSNKLIAATWASQYGFNAQKQENANKLLNSEVQPIAKETLKISDINDSQVETLVKYFYALEDQLVNIRNKARDTRTSIANDSSFKGSLDCNNNTTSSNNIKTNCDNLIKLNAAHAEILKQVKQINTLISTYGKGDMSNVQAKDDNSSWITSGIITKNVESEKKECGGSGVSHSLEDTQVLVSAESNLDPKVRAQMESDYKNLFDSLAVDQTLDDPGVGTFTKQKNGTILYIPSDAKIFKGNIASMVIERSTNFSRIANDAPQIANKWKNQYGYTPAVWCYENSAVGISKKLPPAPAPYDPKKPAASQVIDIYKSVYGRSPTSTELSFGIDCLTGGKWTTQSFQDWLYGSGRGSNGGPLGG